MADPFNTFVDFLVGEMEETGDPDFVSELLAKAKAKIIAGDGEVSFLDKGAVNGKNFERIKELSCIQVAAGCRKALDIYNDDFTQTTYPDFSNLIR